MNAKQILVVGRVGNAWDEFMQGYNAAIKGADLMDMQTQDAVEGWWYARRPKEAGGITPDADWIRNGGA